MKNDTIVSVIICHDFYHNDFIQKKWGLTVNTKTIKVVVFRRGDTIRNDEKLLYNNKALDIVDFVI